LSDAPFTPGSAQPLAQGSVEGWSLDKITETLRRLKEEEENPQMARVFLRSKLADDELGDVVEIDPAPLRLVHRALLPQRPSQKWWSPPDHTLREEVYYLKTDPDDRGPVVIPDFVEEARKQEAEARVMYVIRRATYAKANRALIRSQLRQCFKFMDLATDAQMRAVQRTMDSVPTGRHDPNPYDESAAAYRKLSSERDSHHINAFLDGENSYVLHIKSSQRNYRYAWRKVMTMTAEEAMDVNDIVLRDLATPVKADPYDAWDAAMRSTNFAGWLEATQPAHDSRLRILHAERILLKERINQWRAEQEARREAEAAARFQDEVEFGPQVGPPQGTGGRAGWGHRHLPRYPARRDVFGNVIPDRPALEPKRYIRNWITVAARLIPEFAHEQTKRFLLQHGWFFSVDALILSMYQLGQLWQESDEKLVREFLAEHVLNARIARKALLEALDSSQLDTALKHDYFDVLADRGTKRYRIRLWAPHQNIFLLDHDRSPVLRLCGYLVNSHISSTHLAQKLILETEHTQMHRHSNEAALISPVPVNELFGMGQRGLPALQLQSETDWCLTMAAPRWENVTRELTDEEREEVRRQEQQEQQFAGGQGFQGRWADDEEYEWR
jgi:hypothetical protein